MTILFLFHFLFSGYTIYEAYSASRRATCQSSQRLSTRALLYAGGLIVVQLPNFVARILQIVLRLESVALTALCDTTDPLVELLNMWVFFVVVSKKDEISVWEAGAPTVVSVSCQRKWSMQHSLSGETCS